MKSFGAVGAMFLLVLATVPGCGDDEDEGPSENTGTACAEPDDCYPEVTTMLQGGAVQCMDRVPGGYCTHNCTADTDCCAVPGECKSQNPQVCAPFESTGQMFCFLSCEDEDIAGSGLESNAYCERYAHPSFSCRSTGGGSQNRKVCVPGG